MLNLIHVLPFLASASLISLAPCPIPLPFPSADDSPETFYLSPRSPLYQERQSSSLSPAAPPPVGSLSAKSFGEFLSILNSHSSSLPPSWRSPHARRLSRQQVPAAFQLKLPAHVFASPAQLSILTPLHRDQQFVSSGPQSALNVQLLDHLDSSLSYQARQLNVSSPPDDQSIDLREPFEALGTRSQVSSFLPLLTQEHVEDFAAQRSQLAVARSSLRPDALFSYRVRLSISKSSFNLAISSSGAV
eukprot:TRINITY_DN784_c0_g2_i7.p1 TRINITY_DN784_c0_g2~~TRINITY_DN784_c0_g2_i7.p1  ORF type:complete len:246 (+),score=37.72 TRINITY_DN784_c0_g2_i7:374-1111(+)